MKLAYFDDYHLGVVTGDNVVDVSGLVKDIPHTGPGNLINGLIERFADYRGKLEDAATRGRGVPLAQVKLRPPLPKPVNIECMAVNYMEDGTLKEPAPINAFHKSPSAIIGPGDTMVLPDVPAGIFEGEAELALVIGKRASHVRAADANPRYNAGMGAPPLVSRERHPPSGRIVDWSEISVATGAASTAFERMLLNAWANCPESIASVAGVSGFVRRIAIARLSRRPRSDSSTSSHTESGSASASFSTIGRPSSTNVPTIRLSRSTSRKMRPTLVSMTGSSRALKRRSCAADEIPKIGLRSSWATPAATAPIAPLL